MAKMEKYLIYFLNIVSSFSVVSLTKESSQKQYVQHMSVQLNEDSRNGYPFRNISLTWSKRVDDLVSRLTLEEIQVQMSRGGAGQYGGPAPAIPRLGIGPYNWNTECLRGDGEAAENATAFPQAIGLAATFSQFIIKSVGRATGIEVRAKHNDFVKRGIFGDHTSASCFSPVVNIMRDPRWGRNQETYGEDPFLTGVLAENYVQGLQGENERYILTSAGCKHFDVHGGPENIPVSRFVFDAKVSDTDLRMTFLPAFKKCVEAGTYSVMCSYNSLNGVPTCADKKLLTDILRKEWKFHGYVVSDEGAIENVVSGHHYLNNSVDVAAACINAGTNLELSGNMPTPMYMSIMQAVKQGKLTEKLVRERVKPLFFTRMKLGEFDPPGKNPFAQITLKTVESEAHRKLAVLAAMKSFVLLKNKGNFLPLRKGKFSQVAMLGPMANNYDQLFGDYAPHQDRSFTLTPLQAVRKWVYPMVSFGQVCMDGTPCTKYKQKIVPSVVKGADLVIMALGTGQAIEAEERDRPDTELAGHQGKLLKDVLRHSGNAPVVILLFSASPLNISWADADGRVVAILQCFFPAQATGEALVNTLTNSGQFASPAGRLPYTWPRDITQIPAMTNYSMEGRTYRYFRGEPLYPFGYGLSYTQFEYLQMNLSSSSIKAGEDLSVDVMLWNTGDFDGDEVVQCYIKWNTWSTSIPVIQLAGFIRVTIPQAKAVTLTLTVEARSMALWEEGQWKVKAGKMNLYCGGQQPDQKRQAPSNILAGGFVILGSAVLHP